MRSGYQTCRIYAGRTGFTQQSRREFKIDTSTKPWETSELRYHFEVEETQNGKPYVERASIDRETGDYKHYVAYGAEGGNATTKAVCKKVTVKTAM